jgi:hypothetical protein
MGKSLNSDQLRGLSNFFFDVAKGLVLGGVGFYVVSSFQVKYMISILSGIFAYGCIKMALALLEGVKE